MNSDRFPWNDAITLSGDDPVARVLVLGFSAICDHLAGIESALAGLRREEPTDE